MKLLAFIFEKSSYINSGDPDKTPQNAASEQGLHCLLTECSICGETFKYNTKKITILIIFH